MSSAKWFLHVCRTLYDLLLQFPLFMHSKLEQSFWKENFWPAKLLWEIILGRNIHWQYKCFGRERVKPQMKENWSIICDTIRWPWVTGQAYTNACPWRHSLTTTRASLLLPLMCVSRHLSAKGHSHYMFHFHLCGLECVSHFSIKAHSHCAFTSLAFQMCIKASETHKRLNTMFFQSNARRQNAIFEGILSFKATDNTKIKNFAAAS